MDEGVPNGGTFSYICLHINFILWLFIAISRVLVHFSLKKFVKYKKSHYICSGIGEKSRTADALAYYFALTEKTSEIFFWNSSI